MYRIRTSELIGPALDWAVCEAMGQDYFYPDIGPSRPEFSSDWTLAGPIIEREGIALGQSWECWKAFKSLAAQISESEGPTPLIAVMRSYVASKLGDEVEIPEELIQH